MAAFRDNVDWRYRCIRIRMWLIQTFHGCCRKIIKKIAMHLRLDAGPTGRATYRSESPRISLRPPATLLKPIRLRTRIACSPLFGASLPCSLHLHIKYCTNSHPKPPISSSTGHIDIARWSMMKMWVCGVRRWLGLADDGNWQYIGVSGVDRVNRWEVIGELKQGEGNWSRSNHGKDRQDHD